MRDAEYDYGLQPGERFEPDDVDDELFDPRVPHVMTALGPIDPGALGFTLPNERVVARTPGAGPDKQLDDVALAVAELEGYALTGGRAIVDLTTADRGRSIDDILWVAGRVAVHIVLATGQALEVAESEFSTRSIDQFAGKLIAELTIGIDGTQARAGVIVVGVASEEMLQAAAIAHRATGAPISLQPQGIAAAEEMLRLLLDASVEPSRVIIGPLTMRSKHWLHQPVLESGAFVVIANWAESEDSTMSRAALIAQLVEAGYGEQLLISGNLTRRSDWLAYGGGPGFVHFLDYVPLALMDAGLDARQVRQIFVENPARALTTTRP